jgi:hypothetical protein
MCFWSAASSSVRPAAAVSFVMPQNWLFLKSYKKQREHLLKYATWNLLARLGEHGFEHHRRGVNAILLTLTNARPSDDQMLRGLDASAPKTPEEKAAVLAGGTVVEVKAVGESGWEDSSAKSNRTFHFSKAMQKLLGSRHRGSFWCFVLGTLLVD